MWYHSTAKKKNIAATILPRYIITIFISGEKVFRKKATKCSPNIKIRAINFKLNQDILKNLKNKIIYLINQELDFWNCDFLLNHFLAYFLNQTN